MIAQALRPRSLALFGRTAWGKARTRSQVTAETYRAHQRRFFARPDIARCETDAFGGLRQRVVDLAEVGSTGPILDVCTGAGWQLRAFRDRGCTPAIGVDLVYERLAGAAAMDPGAGTSYATMDAAHLAFADDSFAAASLTFGLHDMPRAVALATLRELARVTRGRVVVVEPIAPSQGLLRRVYAWVGELIDESFYFAEWTRADVRSLLAAAGLDLVHVERVAHGLLAIYVAEPRTAAPATCRPTITSLSV